MNKENIFKDPPCKPHMNRKPEHTCSADKAWSWWRATVCWQQVPFQGIQKCLWRNSMWKFSKVYDMKLSCNNGGHIADSGCNVPHIHHWVYSSCIVFMPCFCWHLIGALHNKYCIHLISHIPFRFNRNIRWSGNILSVVGICGIIAAILLSHFCHSSHEQGVCASCKQCLFEQRRQEGKKCCIPSPLRTLTLSLLRVINVKIPLQPHKKYDITQ